MNIFLYIRYRTPSRQLSHCDQRANAIWHFLHFFFLKKHGHKTKLVVLSRMFNKQKEGILDRYIKVLILN